MEINSSFLASLRYFAYLSGEYLGGLVVSAFSPSSFSCIVNLPLSVLRMCFMIYSSFLSHLNGMSCFLANFSLASSPSRSFFSAVL